MSYVSWYTSEGQSGSADANNRLHSFIFHPMTIAAFIFQPQCPSFPIPLRVEDWARLGSHLHTKTVNLQLPVLAVSDWVRCIE